MHICTLYMHFKFSIILLICLFLTMVGLSCCLGFSLSGESGATLWLQWWASHCRGFSLQSPDSRASAIVARGLIIYSSQALGHRLSSCGVWAGLLLSMWDLGSGIKLLIRDHVSYTEGRFFTINPPGKPVQ